MCWGVTKGFALEKFSGSLNRLGIKDIMMSIEVIMAVIIRVSLYE